MKKFHPINAFHHVFQKDFICPGKAYATQAAGEAISNNHNAGQRTSIKIAITTRANIPTAKNNIENNRLKIERSSTPVNPKLTTPSKKSLILSKKEGSAPSVSRENPILNIPVISPLSASRIVLKNT